jgi:predicted regulator of Ras-like GTPase activity (Roadblock/LC7/MglB family)
MEGVLTQLNAVPGIVGSMVCDDSGHLAAQAFPPLFDAAMLGEAATVLADSAFGLESATGTVDLVDLRYNEARIVIKPMQRSFLLLLCTKAVNLQLLSITLNVACKKLERLFATMSERQAVAAAPPTVAATGAATAAAGAGSKARINGVTLTVQPMKKTAGTYWDSMLEMVSINRGTSIQISDHFSTGSFKKLKLTNPANGLSRKYPVHIIKDDAEHIFDGKVVVSLASMETLGVNAGDPIVAQIEIGGGIFGWEGI